MADIFREVDEDVRRDKALEAFKKYQPWLAGLAIAIVAATAGYRTYDHYRVQAAETAGAQYEAALKLARDGKTSEAEAALSLIGSTGPAGYSGLAQLRRAAEVANHDTPAGVAAYDLLAGNAALGPQWQGIARLRAAMLRVDDADLKEMTARLEPLTAQGQALRHTAREMLAISALKQDDLDAAGKWLDQIVADPQSPESTRRRASELQGLVQGGKPAAAPK